MIMPITSRFSPATPCHSLTLIQAFLSRIFARRYSWGMGLSLAFAGLQFGGGGSPIGAHRQARPVIARIMASPHTWLDGLMGYEAQIAGVGDNIPGHSIKNSIIQRLQQRSIAEVAERRATLIKLVESYGLRLRFVNGGGTGSIVTTGAEAVVTEITVVSAFSAQALCDYYRAFRYQPAAG